MAIVTHTFIEKSNTIIEDCAYNTGLNPILEMNYGKGITRSLIYFDHSKLKAMVDDKTYPDITKFKHVLKMTNAGSISPEKADKPLFDKDGIICKRRASSFDLIFFLIPNEWDMGRGFDYNRETHGEYMRASSTSGANWYQYKTYYRWNNEGIYTIDQLSRELDIFTSSSNEKSAVIIGKQHFDFGNENIELDITDTVNSFIKGEINNYGIGIAFSPIYELAESNKFEYVGFFSQHTHSFFEPYVETTYNETIEDDRLSFYLDKVNKLYFYSLVGDKYTNLDELPTCTVNGSEITVKQATKGIYYIELNLSSKEYESEQMFFDTWSNIKLNGTQFDDVEMEFVTLSPDKHFKFGLPSMKTSTENRVSPNVYGIGYKETIKRGDIRQLNVEFNIPYTSNQKVIVDNAEYRLYVMAGESQIDVIGWQKIERMYDSACFIIDTGQLIPSRYYIDIKIVTNSELLIYEKMLQFDIINNLTETLF